MSRIIDNRVLERVQSPCIRLCTLDDDDICLGCFRGITEICAWASSADDERQRILEAAEARRSAYQQGD